MNGSEGKKDKAVRWTRDVWRKGEWEWVKQLRWTDEMCEGKVSENELSNSDGRMRCVKKRWARTWRKGVSPERPGRTGGGKRADGQTRQKRRTTLDWVSWTPAVRVQRQRPQLQVWDRGFFPDVVGQGQASWRRGSTYEAHFRLWLKHVFMHFWPITAAVARGKLWPALVVAATHGAQEDCAKNVRIASLDHLVRLPWWRQACLQFPVAWQLLALKPHLAGSFGAFCAASWGCTTGSELRTFVLQPSHLNVGQWMLQVWDVSHRHQLVEGPSSESTNLCSNSSRAFLVYRCVVRRAKARRLGFQVERCNVSLWFTLGKWTVFHGSWRGQR